jgi:tetratricopeptide (TPR) repeat protein
MGNADSMQTGLKLFNSDKLTEALSIFETLVKSDPKNSEAKKDAGIVSLRLNNYDKALEYFTMLATDTSLYSNPGKFYEAVTLLKRNKDGDKETAKLLLQQVRDENLEGKSEAEEWLKKL